MLQSLNRIGVKNGFVDLHNHTDRSYGEERNKMNISPVELLESALLYSQENNGAQVTFSITDHNNFDSVFEIKEKIAENPELYKNVRFIKGCEFSCGGSSFGKIVDSAGEKHRIIKGFHVLAYDFDENNEKLKFVSNLYNDCIDKSFVRDSTKISSGRYILSLRNLLHEDGFFAPLEWFYDIDLNTNNVSQIDFVCNLIQLCKEKLNLNEEYCESLKSKIFSVEFFKTFKIEAQELAEIVQEAGGCVVLAHPSLISYAKSFERKNSSTILQKYKNLEQVKFVIDNMKNFQSPYTGKEVRGLVGMEILHSSSFFNEGCFEKLLKLATDNNFYITGGSDSHGTLLMPYFSEIFPRRFSLDFGMNILAINNNLFADKICDNTLRNDYSCLLPFEQQIKIAEADKSSDKILTLEEIKKRNLATLQTKQKVENNTKKYTTSNAIIKNKNSHKQTKKQKKDKNMIKPYYKCKDKFKKYKKKFEIWDDYLKEIKIRKKPTFESLEQEL